MLLPCHRCLTPIALTSAAVLGSVPIAQAANVIAGPTDAQFKIANLPDGNYRFCSDRPPSDIERVSGVCFRFQKESDAINGDYYYPYEGSSICLTGQVNGNTVSGQGLERFSINSAPPDDFDQNALHNWRQEGFLEIGRGVAVSDRPAEQKAVRYRSALLNLNNFYQYNAGTVLPPSGCHLPTTRAASPTPDRDHLRRVGESEFYNGEPICLDETSITAIGDNEYRYQTLVGVPDRLSETEYRLDCENLGMVQVLRSRYYDSDGDLQEVEVVNRAVPAERTEQNFSPSNRRYNANRYICNTYVQN
jgi:hypothetical protein